MLFQTFHLSGDESRAAGSKNTFNSLNISASDKHLVLKVTPQEERKQSHDQTTNLLDQAAAVSAEAHSSFLELIFSVQHVHFITCTVLA